MRGKPAEAPPAWSRVDLKVNAAFGPPEFLTDFEQRSEEWYEARRGIPSSSSFDVITGAATEGETRERYMNRLAGEILTGEVSETYRNAAMERGIAMEPEARETYGRARLCSLSQVGFVRRTLPSGRYVGGSPDALVDQDGVLEIKTHKPEVLIPILKRGLPPVQHRAQCQGTMWVTERSWCDLIVYYRGMPSMTFRFERDESYIRTLTNAVEVFDYDLHKLVKELRGRL